MPEFVLKFLQGSWLNHPLHPILVNLPTALWPAALVLDALSHLSDRPDVLALMSLYAIGLGLAAVLAAVPTGLADWWEVKPQKPAWGLGVYHLICNLLATVLFAATFVARLGLPPDSGPVPVPQLALSALGTVALLVGAYLGGRMVYQHGVGIARNSKQKWRAIAQAGGARVPGE